MADEGLLDIEQMLESSLDGVDLIISDEPPNAPEVATSTPLDMPLDAVELPAQTEMLDDLILDDTLTVIETTDAVSLNESSPDTSTQAETEIDASVLSDDIFSALDADLDLVLDDDFSSPDKGNDDNTAEDLSAILSAIDDNIQNIQVAEEAKPDVEMPRFETPGFDVPGEDVVDTKKSEQDREQAAIDIEMILDGDNSDSDPLEDLMATFLTDDEEETPLDLSIDNISQPEITNIADDTDIELVKSLMADLTDDDRLSHPTTQDALITPEATPSDPPSPEVNPATVLAPEKDAINNVLDEIFELAMEDEADIGDTSDANVETIDANISALLQIAAEAENDAQSRETPADDHLPTVTPEVLDVMPTQADDFPAELTAIETNTEIEDIDSLFSDSLISTVETSKQPEDQPAIITPDEIEPQIVTPTAIAEPLSTHDPDPTTPPSLAIEALAAQTFSLDDLMGDDLADAEESDEVSKAIDAMTTPDTSQVDDPHPSPTVDEAILPEPETPPLTLPDPQPVAKTPPQTKGPQEAQVAPEITEAAPVPEANPTIDIAPTAAPSPEKESPEMTKAAVNESILDEVTESAASGAFASLTEMVEAKTEFEESGPRIGDLVQEALRPMLKEWLDDNLKGIVERAVQKEVKRISSGN